MALENLTLILTGVVCGCCVILCIVVSYLCVSIKRIRRRLDDITGNGTRNLVRDNIKDEEKGKRKNNYTGEPVGKPLRVPSAVYQDPGETVTRLDRESGEAGVFTSACLQASGVGLAVVPSSFSQSPDPAIMTQNIETPQTIVETPQTIVETPQKSERLILEFVNEGFSQDYRMHPDSGEANDLEPSEPIYDNQEAFRAEQPIYENADGEEKIYQNTGELRVINNPEWDRCNTMDIALVH